jgi:iron complex outermembrane receptor protein
VSTICAQNVITGTVKDIQGNILTGVAVIVKGTTVGSVSGNDGQYFIEATNGSTLEFMLIGFTTKETTVSSSVIDAVLEESSEVLDNVVVTALSIKCESRALGYAVSSVKGEDMLKVGVTANPLESLYGRSVET